MISILYYVLKLYFTKAILVISNTTFIELELRYKNQEKIWSRTMPTQTMPFAVIGLLMGNAICSYWVVNGYTYYMITDYTIWLQSCMGYMCQNVIQLRRNRTINANLKQIKFCMNFAFTCSLVWVRTYKILINQTCKA